MTSVGILYPHLPPAHDAIGEHTVLLARALREKGLEVTTWSLGGSDSGQGCSANDARLPGALPRAVAGLLGSSEVGRHDWLIVQYNPFSYGRWGINPWLPLTLGRLRRSVPGLRVLLHVHEPFSPMGRPRACVMAATQRAQLWAIGQVSDHILVSVEAWAEQLARWFPRAAVGFVPISSNLPGPFPPGKPTRTSLRGVWRVDSRALVLGLFGGLGSHRDPQLLKAVASAVGPERMHAVHVGPRGAEFAELMTAARVPVTCVGRVPAAEAAEAISAFDIALAPFGHGVSRRRGSFLAGLQHGVASVTTRGPLIGPTLTDAAASGAFLLTDPDPRDFADAAVRLVENNELRHRTAEGGQRFFLTHQTWEVVARAVCSALDGSIGGTTNAEGVP